MRGLCATCTKKRRYILERIRKRTPGGQDPTPRPPHLTIPEVLQLQAALAAVGDAQLTVEDRYRTSRDGQPEDLQHLLMALATLRGRLTKALQPATEELIELNRPGSQRRKRQAG